MCSDVPNVLGERNHMTHDMPKGRAPRRGPSRNSNPTPYRRDERTAE